MRILQARILEWVAISSSRGSSWSRDWTRVSHIASRFFAIWAPGEAPVPTGPHKENHMNTCTHSGLRHRRTTLSYGNPNVLQWAVSSLFQSKTLSSSEDVCSTNIPVKIVQKTRQMGKHRPQKNTRGPRRTIPQQDLRGMPWLWYAQLWCHSAFRMADIRTERHQSPDVVPPWGMPSRG